MRAGVPVRSPANRPTPTDSVKRLDELPAIGPTDPMHLARTLRGGLPLIAITVAVALAISDWPLGWRFWVDHPYLAAFVAGMALLFVAGAVVDSHFRRREAHRWHGLGFVAAGEFASIQYDTGIAMAALIGIDDGYRLRSDVEFHLAVARDRATELLHLDGGSSLIERHELDDELLRSRLEVLIGDEAWRRSCSQTLRVARGHLVDAVSRWTGTFAILNDDEQFNRVARTVTIMDLITALHMSLVAIWPSEGRAYADSIGFSTFVSQWRTLLDSVHTELDFWNARRRVHARVELPTSPGEAHSSRDSQPAER